MAAYYNEIDPKAAAWLRELIKRGLIAQGEVDERSILEVQPAELAGFTQCHFFAGIGVWSYALRFAGWADDRPVWTGSCPCQPFSAAGKGDEFADERHLWPAWFRLIRERRPVAVFGEQVASKDALSWLDHVSTDLEAEGYAVGAVDTCAAGFGAPHIRQRLYFVADAGRTPRGAEYVDESGSEVGWESTAQYCAGVGARGGAGELANPEHDGLSRVEAPRIHERRHGTERGESEEGGSDRTRRHDADGAEQHGVALGDANVEQREWPAARTGAAGWGLPTEPGAVNGFWGDSEWIPCTDGKARPVKPGTFPLVTGAPARVVRLRGYGNAINAEQARHFIEAFIEVNAGG